jgi:hypothetical protein
MSTTTLSGSAASWRYPAGYTRYELRGMIAEVFAGEGGFITGTATSLGTTATLIDTRLGRFSDNYFAGQQVWIKEADGAAPEGESSFVSGFARSTGTLTFSPVLTVAPGVGDAYQIFRTFTKEQIDAALNNVCKGMDAVASLTPSTSTLDYDLTTVDGLVSRDQVRAVMVRSDGDVESRPARVEGWAIEDNRGVMTLRLPFEPDTDDSLWVVYTVGPGGLHSDDSMVNLPKELIRARTAVHLIENHLAHQDDAGMRTWGQQLRYWNERLDGLERGARPQRKRVLSTRWGGRRRRASRALDALGLTPDFE